MSARIVAYCGDDALGYLRSRTPFRDGEGLRLDDEYRLAHLPLVAPDHPDAIAWRPGRPYAMGRHASVLSLVLPIPEDQLLRSPAFRELEAALRSSSFAAKLDWTLPARRRAKLHATICGSLDPGAGASIATEARQALAGLGPIAGEIRGLFSGDRNVGRLYLRLYPERRAGGHALHDVQRGLGRPRTDLFLVGWHNLVDHLDPGETAALRALLDAWWDRPILRFEAERLWLLSSRDDLVLDSEVVEAIPLTTGDRD